MFLNKMIIGDQKPIKLGTTEKPNEYNFVLI